MSSPLKFALAVLLLLGIFGLVGLLIYKPDASSNMAVAGLIGQLLAALIFVLHSIYRDINPAPTQAPTGAQGASK